MQGSPPLPPHPTHTANHPSFTHAHTWGAQPPPTCPHLMGSAPHTSPHLWGSAPHTRVRAHTLPHLNFSSSGSLSSRATWASGTPDRMKFCSTVRRTSPSPYLSARSAMAYLAQGRREGRGEGETGAQERTRSDPGHIQITSRSHPGQVSRSGPDSRAYVRLVSYHTRTRMG